MTILHDQPARGGIIDRLGDGIRQGALRQPVERDPEAIPALLPVIDALLAYFDPELEGFERLPQSGPMLLVGNHSGGIYMPDFWAFWRHWVRLRGAEDPLYSLGFDLLYSVPGVRTLLRRMGTVPASPANAARLLEQGASVLVYPGGDEDVYRRWTDRHRVDLHGRTGFVRLALRTGVPVVPVVAHGSHDAIMILSRGDTFARILQLPRLRINVLPFVVGFPWGVAVAPLPTWPLPAKVHVRVGEPLDWSHFGPEAAGDRAVVRHCYEEMLGRMQSTLDDLVAEHPHPVMERLRDPLRHLSAARNDRP